MPSPIALLTREAAGLPLWAWGLGAGAGVYLVILRKPSAPTASTSKAGVAAPSPDYATGYQRGYLSGKGFQAVRARSQFSLDKLPNVGDAIHAFDQAHPGIPIRSQASGTAPVIDYIPWGASFETIGTAQSGPGAYPGQSNAWAPVRGGYVNVDDFAQAIASAVGGAGRSLSIGNRSLDPHAYFHPSMKARVRYAHFVRTGIGGAGHEAAVHRTAHTAGIHPARLQALNPTPSGLLWIA